MSSQLVDTDLVREDGESALSLALLSSHDLPDLEMASELIDKGCLMDRRLPLTGIIITHCVVPGIELILSCSLMSRCVTCY